jgi:hypothetical protein
MPAAQRLKRLTSGLAGAAVAMLIATAPSAHAAQTVLVIQDGADSGFNDPTPVEPVGGNDGETLGEQRRIAFEHAAAILGSRLSSSVPIRIAAGFNDQLSCAANSATLGAASPVTFTANFSGASAAEANVFYPVALANALRGERVDGTEDDIRGEFNPRIDTDAECLQGNGWYYGIDGATPSDQPSFVSTVEHELTHGLGFISLVALTDNESANAGQFPLTSDGRTRYPDIYSSLIQDLSFPEDPLWPDLEDEQRADSLTNGSDVVWSDINTGSRAASILERGLTEGRVRLYAPARIRPASSISHLDTSLTPDQIMEPFATGRDQVTNGIGLSSCLLEDIGWGLANGARCPDESEQAVLGAEADAPAAPPTSAGGGDDDGGSGGGGCTLVGEGRFDPVWLVLLLAAAGVLAGRRRRIV